MAKKKSVVKAQNIKPKVPGAKRGRKPKADAASPPTTVAGSNASDPKQRELARHHRDKYIVLKEAQNKANRALQGFGKIVKVDGLKLSQIKLMVALQTPEGEAAFRASVVDDLMAAQWQGAAIGSQLQLFQEPDRTPSGDIAYDEGIQDSMDSKVANPKYDPSVPQYQRYFDGYNAETERRVKEGIKPLAVVGDDVTPPAEPETGDFEKPGLITRAQKDAAVKAKADAAERKAAENAPVAAIPSSGVGITRSQFLQSQRAGKSEARDAAESMFKKATAQE